MRRRAFSPSQTRFSTSQRRSTSLSCFAQTVLSMAACRSHASLSLSKRFSQEIWSLSQRFESRILSPKRLFSSSWNASWNCCISFSLSACHCCFKGSSSISWLQEAFSSESFAVRMASSPSRLGPILVLIQLTSFCTFSFSVASSVLSCSTSALK